MYFISRAPAVNDASASSAYRISASISNDMGSGDRELVSGAARRRVAYRDVAGGRIGNSNGAQTKRHSMNKGARRALRRLSGVMVISALCTISMGAATVSNRHQ